MCIIVINFFFFRDLIFFVNICYLANKNKTLKVKILNEVLTTNAQHFQGVVIFTISFITFTPFFEFKSNKTPCVVPNCISSCNKSISLSNQIICFCHFFWKGKFFTHFITTIAYRTHYYSYKCLLS